MIRAFTLTFLLLFFVPQDGFAQAGWHTQFTGAMTAWRSGVTGKGVTIAIVGPGIDVEETTLKANLAFNLADPINGKDDDKNGYVDDFCGWDFEDNDNDVGQSFTMYPKFVVDRDLSAGMAPGANLLPIKINEWDLEDQPDKVTKAFDYAAARGAKVIFIPWGKSSQMPDLQKKIAELGPKGHLFVVAAGDYGKDIAKQPYYPAAYRSDFMISVAGSDYLDSLAPSSNFGFAVDIAAPGHELIARNSVGDPTKMTGTVNAAALVAGAAALIWEKSPALTAAEVKDEILMSGVPLQTPGLQLRRLSIGNLFP